MTNIWSCSNDKNGYSEQSKQSCKEHKHGDAFLYYSIGGYVSNNSRKGTWGTGAIDEISARLREELPVLRGFSSANIKFNSCG